jgi:hypothetical protein
MISDLNKTNVYFLVSVTTFPGKLKERGGEGRERDERRGVEGLVLPNVGEGT